jgi:RES domain-containing protein
MELSKKFVKFLTAFLFIFAQLAGSFAKASSVEQDLLEKLKSKTPVGGSSGVDSKTTVVNGVVTYTISYHICDSSQRCRYSKPRSYRTTESQTQVDGHFFFTQTVDTGGDQPKRLSFSSLSGTSKTGDMKDLDPKSISSLNLNPSSPYFQDLAQHVPAIASGVMNTIQDMQRSAETARQLQEAYRNVLDQVARAGDGLVNSARQSEAAAKSRSGLINSAIATTWVDSEGFNRDEDFQNYLSSLNDPLGARQYDLTDSARAEHLATAKEAIQKKGIRTAVEKSQVLLNQRDSFESKKAALQLAPAFRDGVAQTASFGVQERSPWDKSGFNTPANTPSGQVLRRIANKSQIAWVETKSLHTATDEGASAYLASVAALRAADESFAQGRMQEGYGLANLADNLSDLTRGAYRGAIKSLQGTAMALPQLAGAINGFAQTLVSDPAEALAMSGRVLESIPGLAYAIVMQKIEMAKKFETGSFAERGEVIGELAGDLVVDWVTEGTFSAIKKGVSSVKVLEKSSRLSEVARMAAKSGLEKSAALASRFAGPRANAMIKMARNNPRAAAETVGIMSRLTIQGQKEAAEFLGRATAAEARYLGQPGNAKRLAVTYTQIQARLKNISPVNFDGEITRGIPAQVPVAGGFKLNSKADVFDWHQGIKRADGRYSLKGPEGQEALYTAMGSGGSVQSHILSEMKDTQMSNVIFDSQSVRLSGGLDLTNPAVRKELGVNLTDITKESAAGNSEYLLTQVIGHAAEKEGYKFILAPSAVDKTKINVILLGK